MGTGVGGAGELGPEPLGTSQQREGSGQELAPVLWLCAGVPVVLDVPFGLPSASLGPAHGCIGVLLSPVMSGLSGGAGRPGRFQGVDPPVSPPSIPVGIPAVLSSTVRSALYSPLEAKQSFSQQTAPPGPSPKSPGRLAPRRPAPNTFTGPWGQGHYPVKRTQHREGRRCLPIKEDAVQ